MIAIEDYRDWYEFSGLCLDLRTMENPTPHRCAYLDCVRFNLCEAGFHAWHIANLLSDYPVPYAVDIFAGMLHPTEVAFLAGDMQAIGAARWAAALVKASQRKTPARDASDASPVDVETSQELRGLLKQYVAAHQADLAEDMRRHGDPRQGPGFNRRKAAKAIEEREDACNALREMDARLQELTTLLQALGAQPSDREVKQEVRRLVQKIRQDYQTWSRQKSTLLADLTSRYLADVKSFMDGHADLFSQKPTVAPYPADVQARLAALGPYRLEERGRRVIWEAMPELTTDYAPFQLVFEIYDEGREANLLPDDGMFELWENYRKLHPGLIAAYHAELVAHYRNCATSYLPDEPEAEQYPQDLPEADILAMVRGGRLMIRRTIWQKKPQYEAAVTFDIDWEEEHGFGTLLIDGDGRIVEHGD